MSTCECCRYFSVIDIVRWGLYGAGGVATWFWYDYLSLVDKARSLAHFVPSLEGQIHTLYYLFIGYPAVLLVAIIASLGLARMHQKFLATIVALVPLAYLGVVALFGMNLRDKAMGMGKEIFKREVIQRVEKLIPKDIADKIPKEVGDIGKKLFN